MNRFFFRRQVLHWEYLLNIPSLLVRLLVTVAHDIPKMYRAREVTLGIFGFVWIGLWRFRLIVLGVGGDRPFHDGPRLRATGLFCLMSLWGMPPQGRRGSGMSGWHIHSNYNLKLQVVVNTMSLGWHLYPMYNSGSTQL